MKKLWLIAIVACLALLLVACGGGEDTTAEETQTTSSETEDITTSTTADTTAEVTTTTTDEVTTTEPVVDNTDEPLFEGIDILNGEWDDMAINPTWNGINACAFENHHRALGYRIALVFKMEETTNGIYETLVITTDTEGSNESNWEMDLGYTWYVIIDDEEIKIENFSILNDQTSGYIRLDLGDWQFSEELDANGEHAYDIKLKICDTNNEVAFWAWFTDPEWNGLYYFKIPDPIVMVDDVDRDASHVAISNAEVTPLFGPAGFNASETYDLLFDGRVDTKLCTSNTTDAIEWCYSETKHIVSYSLVGANDDASYTSREPLVWTLYGSTDGATWEEIDSRNLDTLESVNYGERNFVLDTPAEYRYFRLALEVSAMYQMSEIILYTDTDHAAQ